MCWCDPQKRTPICDHCPPERKAEWPQYQLQMDAGAGESDYPASLTFTSSKFIVTAFGYDKEHCEDVLQCVLLGRFKDHEGDREFIKEK